MIITKETFTQAYDKYKNTVYSVIFNYMRNIDDTADILQEVFIKLLNCNIDYEDDEHLRAWLIRVSINMCKNQLRNKSHLSAVPLSEEIPYTDKVESNDLLKCVLALPEKYRIPIHLFYYEDYSIKQIANVLEIPESTVKIRLKRGKEKMKKTLNEEDWLW